MYLLPDEAFGEAMAAYARHGLAGDAEQWRVPADEQDGDPLACSHEVELGTVGAGTDLGPPALRRAGSWRADWLAEVLRAEGLTVVEVAGWKTRGYAYPGPPQVSLFHHTASGRASGPTGGLHVVVYGRPGLDGPIANWLTGRNGVIYVIASGVANNAGHGNARAAGLPQVTGNTATFGNEMENDGTGEKYSPVQYTAAIKSHAAVHRRLGWPASRGIGHKEWSTTGKTDPVLDMAQVRRDLATAIARGPGPTPGGNDEDMNADQFAALLRDKTVRALLGEIVKETRVGFSASPDGKGYPLGGMLLTVYNHVQAQEAAATKGAAAHETGDQDAASQ